MDFKIIFLFMAWTWEYSMKTYAQFVDIPCLDCEEFTYAVHVEQTRNTALCNEIILNKQVCTFETSPRGQSVYFASYLYNGEASRGTTFTLLHSKLPPPFRQMWFEDPVCVRDITKPVFSNVPVIPEMVTEPNLPDVSVTWTIPTVTDDSCWDDITPVSTSGHTPGDRFVIGDTTVIYTATDPAGNTETTMFDVTVIDIDECGTDNDNCHVNAMCGNTNGGFTCTCTIGFIGDGVSCTDKNECETNNGNCDEDANCDNIVGSFTCTCDDGYSGNGFTCTDINECDTNADNCHENAMCVNTDGSFTCTCKVGYSGNGVTCTDINECTTNPETSCDENAVCANNIGSFTCTCKDGYSGNGVDTCTDISECGTSDANCHVSKATCTNTIGSFTCSCKDGYSGDGITCIDIIECTINPDTCHMKAMCANTIGSFTCTCNDGYSGNGVDTCTDTEDPTISNVPDDIIENIDLGQSSGTVDWISPVANDNSGQVTLDASLRDKSNNNVIVQSNLIPPQVLNVGKYTVTYTATDPSGRTATAMFDITVQVNADSVDPVFTDTPSDIIRNTDLDKPTASVEWTAPEASDNSAVTVTPTHTSPYDFPIGTTMVIYTAVDDAGNTATTSFTVTVNDKQDPKFDPSTLSDITEPADLNKPYHIAMWVPPEVTDNSGKPVTLTSTHNPGDEFSINPDGVVVTYTAEDQYGNTETLSFTVTVTDEQIPKFLTSLSDIPTGTDPMQPHAVVTWEAPEVTDNSGEVVTLTSTHDPGATFSLSPTDGMTMSTVVTYTAVDLYNNMDTLSFTVTVTDYEDPVISNFPVNKQEFVPIGDTKRAVSWTLPEESDNSGFVTLTSTNDPMDVFDLGPNIVIYTAIDPTGNMVMKQFTITVTASPDSENPVIINTPDDITQNTDLGKPSAVVSWERPDAMDSSGTPDLTSTHNPGDIFNIGPTIVTYTAKDLYNNMETSSFMVTIIDNENPVISGTFSDITQDNDPTRGTAIVRWNPPVVSDNSGSANLRSSHSPGNSFPIGPTTVTYTATDPSGNVAPVRSFIITVIDVEPPVFTGTPPPDISQDTDLGQSTTTVTWTPPSARDNDRFTLTSTHQPGASFPIGPTTVTYTATDPSNNMATVSFTVTVGDTQGPVISGIPDEVIEANTDPGQPDTEVTWTPPTATDDNGPVTLTSTHQPGTRFNIGTHTVVYTAVDQDSNVVTESFEVKVIDEEKPVITGTPADITVGPTNPTKRATVEVTWTPPTARDNSGEVTLTSSKQSGDPFEPGTTTVSYIARDSSGNSASTSFKVTVNGGEPPAENPVISNIPADITQNTDLNRAVAVVTWQPPTARDIINSVPVQWTPTHRPGDTFPIGTTTVIYTARATNGNVNTASFTVTVRDAENPVFSRLPDNIVQDSTFVTWLPPIATDNSGSVVLTSNRVPGSTFPIGTTTVSLTATDPSNNIVIEVFSVTVEGANPTTGTGITPTGFFLIWGAIVALIIALSIIGCIIVSCIASNSQSGGQATSGVNAPPQLSTMYVPGYPEDRRIIFQRRRGIPP